MYDYNMHWIHTQIMLTVCSGVVRYVYTLLDYNNVYDIM